MANFTRVSIPQIYIGEHADTKPTSAPVGSKCYETDTSDWYITADGSCSIITIYHEVTIS